jgi:uncharacterized protein YjgD (DUF1641 family)
VIATHTDDRAATGLDELLDRLSQPANLRALNSLVDQLPLLAVLVEGIDGLARKGDVITDTIAEVLEQLRAAGRASGLDLRETTEQLATLIPTFAEAAPAIKRVATSSIVHEDAVAVVGETGLALAAGYETAQREKARVGPTGMLRATRDPDVQRGLGFLIEVAREIGRQLDEPAAAPAPSTPTTAT